MKQIINHFTDNDLYTFTCMYYIIQTYPRAEVEYTFFDRNGTVYPQGFDKLLQEQVDYMKNVVIQEDEIEFMLKKCYYLPKWFIDVFLRGFRFNTDEVSINQDLDGHLHVSVKGKWYSAIIWEMPILSCVSELFHILNGDDQKYDLALEIQKVRKKTIEIFGNGLILGDMGTRRRFSFDHQKMVLTQMKDVYENGKFSGTFTGTSNVWFAKELNLNPLGTMSHQIISFEENVTSVFEVNHSVMEKWASVYNGDLGLYLYDCFGDDVFFNNFSKKSAMLFSGLRVDSGNEEEQIDKIVQKYTELGINPQTKQVIFSNGLNIKRAIEIQKYALGKIRPSFGVGTFLTCDLTDIKPMNIVVKLTKSRITESREWHDCVKLSCDKGKTLGNQDKCKYLLSVIC
ncbi:MAG: nicotinate phosphoribosyltransferase [Bacteroidales bacterium]|nr:nicotinate phosphoribosyltransferase [Bacteroidales bacterium]MBR6279538.1 nicotinate phosphoribosyltransferase [Bacteroidales bacterium]